MSRRRLVALISAGILLLLGMSVIGAILATTQTDLGRARLRSLINAQVTRAMGNRGTMYIGRITGSLFTGVELDSVSIRDEEDSLVVATGPVIIRYDPRDLLDKRLLLSYFEVNRPNVYLRRRADHQWSFRHVFPDGPKKQPLVGSRSIGDYIVMDSAVLHDLTFTLTDLWSPPDSLKGARRDSAIKVALNDKSHEWRRTGEGIKQTRRWTKGELRSPYVRLADPDSIGKLISIGNMSVSENDPPLEVRNATGPVRIIGDTVFFDLHHFDLPGSTGHAKGLVSWHGPVPTHYDVRVWGDSVSMKDVAWVYPTLPRTGSGKMELTIRNNARDAQALEYGLTKMDMRSTKSHLTGAMTFVVGLPVLAVTNVDAKFSPLDFDLLRTLAGGPFPVDWQGQFTGSVKGPGGLLTDWHVDDGQMTFRDAHVRGAVTKATVHGALDILVPSNAKFHSLDLDLATLDLRTIQYLFPSFPRLEGTVSGTARLDSSWLDTRFHDADVVHHDGANPTSHFTGDGRVTQNPKFTAFDVTLQAQPVSFTTFARSYPGLAFRGNFSGPMRIRGTLDDLDVTANLSGDAGTMVVNGNFDLDSVSGLAGRGTASMADLDVQRLMERPALPSTSLAGRAAFDVHGDSIANLVGSLTVDLDQSRVEPVDVTAATASLTFGDGRMHVDTLSIATSAARIFAKGTLGLAPTIVDSLSYAVLVDSLGGLRPWILPRVAADSAPRDSAARMTERDLAARQRADSLYGTAHAEGMLIGSIDTLLARGVIAGDSLFVSGNQVMHASGRYDVAGLPADAHGTISARADSLVIATVAIDSMRGELTLANRSHGDLAVSAVSSRRTGSFVVGSHLAFDRSLDSLQLVIDSLGGLIDTHAWGLASPATIVLDTAGTRIDSLVAHSGEGGAIVVHASLPNTRPVNVSLRADSVSLADLGVLAQLATPISGTAAGTVDITGPRAAPVMTIGSRFQDVSFGTVAFPYFTLNGSYANRLLDTKMIVFRHDTAVMSFTGSWPLNLALLPVQRRMLDEPLKGHLAGDSLDLSVLETFSPSFSRPSGTASVALDLSGTWRHPLLTGRMRVRNGEMGLPSLGTRLRHVVADVGFRADSVRIDTLSMSSGTETGSKLSVRGSLVLGNMLDLSEDLSNVQVDLSMSARNFLVVDKRSVARLELSDDVRLVGPFSRMVLTGNLNVERATFYLPELAQKTALSLDPTIDPDVGTLVDTNLVEIRRTFLGQQRRDVQEAIRYLQVPSLEVEIGNDVWLRSAEANIKLGGQVALRKDAANQRFDGSIDVERGTYRLDLGLVQRTFEVDSGTVTFYNDPQQAGTLNIWATYTVRQANQLAQDVRIIAHIGGTLLDPKLDLSSDERIALSYTEILSYLVFGQPSLLGSNDANNSALRPVAQALLPSAGALIERAINSQIGFFDVVQIQTGSTNTTNQADQSATNFLSGSRIGVGKQLGQKTFLTADAGLCQLGASSSSFSSTIGITLEYRIAQHFSLQASSEPSTLSLLCRPGITTIGNRPRQFGFDLFRDWSF
ncbi:MAG: translocation/assembly module TamB domain-containing protein [Gemmatimonadota bacterium]|nr:translocation/assembly module TamB domain-containing protein [Gemmatimonadota bacterium]